MQCGLEGSAEGGGGSPGQACLGCPLKGSLLTHPSPPSTVLSLLPPCLGALLVTLNGPAAKDACEPRLRSDPGLGAHSADAGGKDMPGWGALLSQVPPQPSRAILEGWALERPGG